MTAPDSRRLVLPLYGPCELEYDCTGLYGTCEFVYDWFGRVTVREPGSGRCGVRERCERRSWGTGGIGALWSGRGGTAAGRGGAEEGAV